MGVLKNRDFIYKGLQFHLNDSKYHNEFTPKYLLMFWNDSFGYWQEQIHVGSKKEALAYIRKCEKSHCRMFARLFIKRKDMQMHVFFSIGTRFRFLIQEVHAVFQSPRMKASRLSPSLYDPGSSCGCHILDLRHSRIRC